MNSSSGCKGKWVLFPTVPYESVNSLDREARGPQAAGGNKTASAEFFPFLLTTPGSAWTFLKPWANQRIFLMEMFSLSFANETMYLL